MMDLALHDFSTLGVVRFVLTVSEKAKCAKEVWIVDRMFHLRIRCGRPDHFNKIRGHSSVT